MAVALSIAEIRRRVGDAVLEAVDEHLGYDATKFDVEDAQCNALADDVIKAVLEACGCEMIVEEAK